MRTGPRWQTRLIEYCGWIANGGDPLNPEPSAADLAAAEARMSEQVRQRTAVIFERVQATARRKDINDLTEKFLVASRGAVPTDPAGQRLLFDTLRQLATEFVDWRISKDARPATP